MTQQPRQLSARLLFFIAAITALICCINANERVPLRVISFNVGNMDLHCRNAGFKLCRPDVANRIHDYIVTYNPDIVLLTEVLNSTQLLSREHGDGRLLHSSIYDGTCGRSIDRDTGGETDPHAPNSSGEHECIGWRRERFSLVPGSDRSVYGRNDEYGRKKCNFDFTGFALQLVDHMRGGQAFTVAVVHPDSTKPDCRRYEIEEYWDKLVDHDGESIIAGDWNAGIRCLTGKKLCSDNGEDLQYPPPHPSPFKWRTIYSNGIYWDGVAERFPHDPTAAAVGPVRLWIDHAFANFGEPCFNCGHFYDTEDFKWGAAVGGSDGMERADGGSGCDHRQIIWDMWV